MMVQPLGIPAIGMGLWKIERSQASELVQQAIGMGYRHLDAACDYGNEAEVGDGIKQALAQGLCRREELWITSKLWNTYHRAEHVRPALEKSLLDLGLDYLDLYLIHFPIALEFVPFDKRYPPGWFYDPTESKPSMKPTAVPLLETWQAMEELVDRGLVKHIGVSNFGTSLIRDLLSYTRIRPSVLQVESHPYLVQAKLMRYCQQEQIHVTAFSPLGAGSYVPLGMATASQSVLEDPVIRPIAARHQRTEAQIVLRWGIQRGNSIVPKSSHHLRLQENLKLDDFVLSDDEMKSIDGLDRHQRFNDPGEFCESAFGCFFPIHE